MFLYGANPWGDFPGGPVAKNLPSNAGHAGCIPGQGTKISHAVKQLNPRTTTRETMYHNEERDFSKCCVMGPTLPPSLALVSVPVS